MCLPVLSAAKYAQLQIPSSVFLRINESMNKMEAGSKYIPQTSHVSGWRKNNYHKQKQNFPLKKFSIQTSYPRGKVILHIAFFLSHAREVSTERSQKLFLFLLQMN